MASFIMTVPDTIVPLVSKALARRMGIQEPTTDADKVIMAQTFCKQAMKEATMDYRAQEAGVKSRTDTTDGVVNW